MSHNLTAGSEVILNGKRMTIKSIDGETANCIWFDRKSRNWDEKDFPVNILNKYEIVLLG